MNQPGIHIGIDLGGTKTSGICLDSDNRVLGYKNDLTPRGDYAGTISNIRDIISALAPDGMRGGISSSGVKPPTVGIGIPGSLSPETGLVRNANSTWLNGRDLKRDIEAALGRPVMIENDANCFALSEALDGSAAGADCVLGLIIGTGIGAGIVENDRIRSGRNRIAGEWGHNPLPAARLLSADTVRCWCGREDCIEAHLSGPALEARAALNTGHRRTATQLSDDAQAGDPTATEEMDRYLEALSGALAAVVNILDPDAIVIGGGLSGIAGLYSELPERLGNLTFGDSFDTPILRPTHGSDSGVRGAAALWNGKEDT